MRAYHGTTKSGLTQGLIEIQRGEGLGFTAKPMSKEAIGYVIWLLRDESVKAALHLEDTSPGEWKKAFAKNLRDKDEANFVLYRGGRPIGWLKLNGLKGDKAWISMLAVHPAHQRMGAGRFAVSFAEQFAREKGFGRLKIHTTPDNAPARACYEGLGYALTDENERMNYCTYIKEFGRNT